MKKREYYLVVFQDGEAMIDNIIYYGIASEFRGQIKRVRYNGKDINAVVVEMTDYEVKSHCRDHHFHIIEKDFVVKINGTDDFLAGFLSRTGVVDFSDHVKDAMTFFTEIDAIQYAEQFVCDTGRDHGLRDFEVVRISDVMSELNRNNH